jgi:hypothetical protein
MIVAETGQAIDHLQVPIERKDFPFHRSVFTDK